MHLLYSLGVRLYGLAIRLASLRGGKAALWVKGRRNWSAELRRKCEALGSAKKIWVHCASYGEFEQGRPVMEAIRQQHPEHKIVLSFFSPSGYEPFHQWSGADLICYLPLDTKRNARLFLDIVKPGTVIFIKYEFWVNFLGAIRQRQIPAFLVSAVFKPHHPFFKWYGGVFIRSLQSFSRLLVQDEASAKLLAGIGVNNVEVCGDTRFDRVLAIREKFVALPYFEQACHGRRVIVAGSTWPGDEENLLEALKMPGLQNALLILAPHNVDEKSIAATEKRIIKSGLSYLMYSTQTALSDQQVLVIDSIGLLSRLYYYAQVSYVGGGFDSGIHNVLEPAVFGKPVLFYGGSDYHKYNEAVDLLREGCARNTATAAELAKNLNDFLGSDPLRAEVAAKLAVYYKKNSGTTQRVMELISW